MTDFWDDLTIGHRIEILLFRREIEKQSFAKQIGVSPESFSRILLALKREKNGTRLWMLKRIAKGLNVRMGWLIEGEEPMERQKTGPAEASPAVPRLPLIPAKPKLQRKPKL